MSDPMRSHEPVLPLEHERELVKSRRMAAVAALLAASSALLLAVVAGLWLLWLVVATPQATAFDSDGVRCYRAAAEMSCLKTAEPAR
jgi:hypothetical protein